MSVKKSGGVIAVLAAILLLAGCSAISDGYITNKTFTPSYTTSSVWCHLVGKVTICQPITTFHPDSWQFDIKKEDETGYVSVTEEEYNSYETGEYYPAR